MIAAAEAEALPPECERRTVLLQIRQWIGTVSNNLALSIGGALLLTIIGFAILGPYVWNTNLARIGSAPLTLPPAWIEGGQAQFPFGTDASGRDMLSLLIIGVSMSLRVGFIAAGFGLFIAIVLGFSAGFLGGIPDAIIRTAADIAVTIPALAVLVVLSVYVRVVSTEVMAVILALFSWPGSTRIIRAQVLIMRERGYIRMARLSGMSTFGIMFREMMPNLLPYLAANLAGNISGAILSATGLEALGLGPVRIPTLGMSLYNAIQATALGRGLWWWWGFPIIVLILIFVSLFLISIGLDTFASPSRRTAKSA